MAGMTKPTATLLLEWADWVRHPDLRMGARCGLAVIMAANVGGTVSGPRMSDDDALRVDRVVAQLRARNERLYVALRLSYVDELSYREMAVRLRCDQKKALALINQAVAWVDGALTAVVDA